MPVATLLWFALLTVGPPLALSWWLGFVVRRQAPRWGLIDLPASRKVHTTPTPLGGGLAIWGAIIGVFAAGTLALWLASGEGAWAPALQARLPAFAAPHLAGALERLDGLWTLLALATALMLLGLADDRYGLDWRLRLGVQVAVAIVCVLRSDWRLTGFIDSPWLTGALSVVWIVGLVNAFNMLDNMDGLSAGVASITAAMLAAVLLSAPDLQAGGPQLFVSGFLLVVVGALLGFLLHNRPPARLFMGDAGSYLVGFCIALATLQATFTNYASPQPHTIFAPLCVLATPLYDLISVVTIRLCEGRSPFEADKRHFSHRLVALGMTRPQAVLTIYLVTFTCGLGALALYHVDLTGAVVVLAMVACQLILIAILEAAAARRGESP